MRFLRNRWRDLYEAIPLCDRLPVPPEHLCMRVSNGPPDQFLAIGRLLYLDLQRILKSVGRSLAAQQSVLDFGCGPGRVLRYLSPEQQILGVDIDPEAVEWAQRSLPHVRVLLGPQLPPLSFAAESFDFIYAISVFTHLPEEMADAWVAELARLVKRSGVCIVTTLGETLFNALCSDVDGAADQWEREGYYYWRHGGTPGLPDFYQLAFHTREYAEARWSRWFSVVRYDQMAINKQQDSFVLAAR